MSTSDELFDWQMANNEYLAAALKWLRLRLQRYIELHQPSFVQPPSVATPPDEPTRRRPVWVRPGPAVTIPPAAEASAHRQPTVTETQVGEAEEEMRRAEMIDPQPALLELGARLNLSRFERTVLLFCAAMELDPYMPGLCALAQGTTIRPSAPGESLNYPTFALVLDLLAPDVAYDIVSPRGGLRFWRLIEVNQMRGVPLNLSPLAADERIVNYIKGLDYLDDRLEPLLSPVDLSADLDDIPASQREVIETIAYRWAQAIADGDDGKGNPIPVAQLLGPSMSSKLLVAAGVAAVHRRSLYRLPAELLPTQPGDLETLARLWQRESALSPVVLYLDAEETDHSAGGDGQAALVRRFLSRCSGNRVPTLIFLGSREVWPDTGRPSFVADVSQPAEDEQQAAWEDLMRDEIGDVYAGMLAARLAGQFNLNGPTIRHVAHLALSETVRNGRALDENLWELCRASTRPQLEALAQRLDAKATWDDIVLPKTEMALLHQIADQVAQRSTVYRTWGFGLRMNRGFGINALFAGPSGTGKTMAAEVIANALQLDLYRIDLSGVVSKYIGETEKNLRRLFDAAEGGGAMLFFDEADALFGKRSEVKDSHDRYANIEINYLLQRMETYRGLAILATNMKTALDTAFMRRLRFIVTFATPGVAERRLIWARVFPPEAPVEALDLDRLARLPATGGMVHTIALNAAFMAAHRGTPVTMQVIMDAARTEFQKSEMPVPEREFILPAAVTLTEPVRA
jgi:hypothetical protein